MLADNTTVRSTQYPKPYLCVVLRKIDRLQSWGGKVIDSLIQLGCDDGDVWYIEAGCLQAIQFCSQWLQDKSVQPDIILYKSIHLKKMGHCGL